MPREKEDFRANLEVLNSRFPDHDMLTRREAMQVMGWKSCDTANKYIQFVANKVSKATLARLMCG